jgi:hypothetical protein
LKITMLKKYEGVFSGWRAVMAKGAETGSA